MPLNRVHALAFVVFVVISAISLRSFFVNGDPVAFHDLAPMYRLDQLSRPYDFPWDYKSNLGSPSLLTGNAVYNLPLIGLSVILGSVAFAHKVLLVLLMALAGFGFYLAFEYLFKSKTAGFVAGLFMIFNPFTLGRWQYGHNTVLMTYAVLPFAVLCFLKVMKEGGKLSMFVCGVLTGLMIYLSPQVAFMFILFAMLYTAFDLAFAGKAGIARRAVLRGVQGSVMLVTAVIAAFPFFYQLVMANAPVYSTRPEEATVAFSPMDIGSSLIPQVSLIAIVIAAFVLLWWRSGFTSLYRWWRNGGSAGEPSPYLINVGSQQVQFFAVLGFLSVVLVILVLPPLTPVYQWVFVNVPGFGMFREVSKFFMLAAFSTAFFVALAAEGLKRHLVKTKNHSVFRKILPALLISLLISAASWQFVTGDIGGSVGTVQIPTEYQEFNSWLASQEGDFRVAFFPPAIWATTYPWASRWFLDPYVALQAQPTLEVKSDSDLTQSAQFVRWAYAALYANRSSDLGRFLGMFGVKYVVLRTDADMPSYRSDMAPLSRSNTQALWSSQSDLRLVKNFSSILVYENPYALPHMYQTDGFSLVVGDRDLLFSLNSLNLDFSRYPPAFLDDNINIAKKLVGEAHSVFFQGDPYWSMLASFLGENYIVKPWLYAPVSTNPWIQWVSGDLIWSFFNATPNAVPDGFMYTEGEHTMTIPLNAPKPDLYRVLIQVCDGLPYAQGINFTVEGSNYVFKPTNKAEGSYRWIEIGSYYLNTQSALQVSDLGGPAAVSKVLLAPASAVSEVEQNVQAALQASGAKLTYLFDDRVWNYDRNALVVNPNAVNGRLIRLQNSTAETELHVFNNDAYTLKLAFQSPDEDTIVKVYVDGHAEDVHLNGNGAAFSTVVEIGPFNLSRGSHRIAVEAEADDARFNMATLENHADDSSMQPQSAPDVPSYSMLSGSEYTVNPTADYVVFLEAVNEYWELEPAGASSPIRIFNFASLFPVYAQSSPYTLRYMGADYVAQGFIVAVAGTAALALVLAFLYPKRFIQGKPQP
ncbi:MAG: hypothetical protein ACE14S_08115 [Candidatus Bathyarchaeia archaeon]